MSEIPSVSFATELGSICRDGRISSIDIDYEELTRTLDSLGEYGYQERLPLNIVIGSWRERYDHTLGRAWVEVSKEDGVALNRNIHVPLFEYNNDDRKPMLSYDMQIVNETMVHELQHVVDYNDEIILNEHDNFVIKNRSKLKNSIRRSYIPESAFALASAGLAVRSGLQRELADIPLSMAGGAVAYYAYKIDKLYREIFLPKKFNLSTPLEKRAQRTVEKMRAAGVIPQIVKLHVLEGGQAD